MPAVAQVTIHASQFPQNVRRDLLESLRTRLVNHKFHYDSVKQAQQWLALHRAYSPSRTDPGCAAIYDQSFAAAASRIRSKRVHLVGLGCGGGQKDTRLIQRLHDLGKEVFYTPSDVSTAMVLTAWQSALTVIAAEKCTPFVCDLASSEDLPAILSEPAPADTARLITFFGMLPNFEPAVILPRLAALVRPGDCLLLSANLAPGSDYAAGVRRILPLYDNTLTRDWLMTFLLDLGVARRDGELRFAVENGRFGLKRVTAYFHFKRSRQIAIESEAFAFQAGEAIRLFFSYRYTPERVQQVLAGYGLKVCDQWIAKSGEEGVFLCCPRR